MLTNQHIFFCLLKLFYRRKVLGLSSGIEDLGKIQWELAVSLLVVWILVYFCVRNGIKTSGKVVYFTGIKHESIPDMIIDVKYI